MFTTFLRKAAAAYTDRHPWQVELGPLGAVRDFVALDDVVAAVERAIDRDVADSTINVCTGHGRTVADLVLAVMEELSTGEIKADEGVGSGVAWSVGDPARCQALLGVTPSSDLNPVIRQAAAWIRTPVKATAHA